MRSSHRIDPRRSRAAGHKDNRLRAPRFDDLIPIKEIAISSREERVAADEWNAAGIEMARRGIARDERDINLLRQLQAQENT